MAHTPEQIDADNSAFANTWRAAIRTHLPLNWVATLDYGAGSKFPPYDAFGVLFDYERIVQYDPNADVRSYWRLSEEIRKSTPVLTNFLPASGQFHLVGFHFSLHHMEESLERVLGGVRRYHPLMVAIMDYDFTKATKDEFAQAFVTQAEQRELREQFKGDVRACYNFHRKLGIREYEMALWANKMKVLEKGLGQGAASHKFFLLGQ